MSQSKVLMGTLGLTKEIDSIKSVTFCVTEECNLRCKYCYMIHKNSFKRMSFETAKKAVDFVLSQSFEEKGVAWEFIGGEPTLEMKLIDQITDYIKLKMYELNHPWFNNFYFSIGTNGVLYDSPEVQAYIKKNISHLSFSITLDGTKEKQNLQRVYADGTGSYDDVVKNIPLWLAQFPNSTTKVTFASEDLKYLKDSIIHLWNMGMKIVPANIVFEDVWKAGDEAIFRNQLMSLADYIIDNHLWEDYSVRFFDPVCGLPLSKEAKSMNCCGSGQMIAIDCEGNLYPCIRFLDFCMPNSSVPLLKSGNITDGFNSTVLDMFKKLSLDIKNDGECRECPIAGDCFACTGNDYCYSSPHNIFSRTKYHCSMHKAQAEANDYFWDKLSGYINEPSPREIQRRQVYLETGFTADGTRLLYIMLDDAIPSFCMYESNKRQHTIMSPETFEQCLSFARKNYMLPVFVGDPESYLAKSNWNQYFVVIDVYDTPEKINKYSFQTPIPIITPETVDTPISAQAAILMINKQSVKKLYSLIKKCGNRFSKINITIQDLDTWDDDDILKFHTQLVEIRDHHLNDNVVINAIQDSLNPNVGCAAGTKSWAVSPSGSLYICPAFYYSDEESIGDVFSGMKEYDKGIFGKKNRECSQCKVPYCKKCFSINKKCSMAVNIPAKIQCTTFKTLPR